MGLKQFPINGANRTNDLARRRFNLLGSPNVCHTVPVCWIPNFWLKRLLWLGAFDNDVMGGAKCIVIWGYNPGASYLSEMKNTAGQEDVWYQDNSC